MPDAIYVKDLTKTYLNKATGTKKEALKEFSLVIPQGSFFGLLGPNGAGKSTFINILAGLTLKTSGTVLVNGYNIDNQLLQAKTSLGVVPQELIIDPFFTVRETLENNAGYYGIPKSKRKTDEIIEALGLSDKANSKPRTLSGGMRRRLLIAKALVHNPPVLILDEPTAGVDIELRKQLWDYVKHLNKQGTTIVLTTHYLEEAEQLCEQIAIINHGKIIANDKIDNLMHILDYKRLIVTFNQPLNHIPAQFKEFDAELTGDGKLVLKYKYKTTSINTVLDIIKQSGLEVIDLVTSEADLEDIFRYLTSEH